jgi:hypothetical protein
MQTGRGKWSCGARGIRIPEKTACLPRSDAPCRHKQTRDQQGRSRACNPSYTGVRHQRAQKKRICLPAIATAFSGSEVRWATPETVPSLLMVPRQHQARFGRTRRTSAQTILDRGRGRGTAPPKACTAQGPKTTRKRPEERTRSGSIVLAKGLGDLSTSRGLTLGW